MTPLITIRLSGEPKGKGRPRMTRAGHAFTPAATRSYEAALRYAAQEAMGSRIPLDGPLSVRIEALMPIPASWSRKRQAAALAGDVLPTGRPDVDNILKMVDGLNGVVWTDDARIVSARIDKRYSDAPALIIHVALFGAETAYPIGLMHQPVAAE